MYFGFKSKEYEYTSPTCKMWISPNRSRNLGGSHPLVHSVSNDTQIMECLYSFRYAADNGKRDPEQDCWSIRQTALYQRYDFRTAKVVWVGIGVSRDAEALIHTHLKGESQKSSILDIFVLHTSLIHASLADWRWLLLDVKKKVQKLVCSIHSLHVKLLRQGVE